MTKHKVFETERLILKPTSVEDAVFILELFNNPTWIQFIGDRNIKTVESAREFISKKIRPQLERLGYATYTVSRKTDHKKIGTCGLYDREGLDGIDIGFAFLPEFQNKGYAFEAAIRVKEIAAGEFGITELKAITTTDNIQSQKLLEKIGFTCSGTIKLKTDTDESLLYIG